MYPKNAASPPIIAVGQVILIADGSVVTADALVRVKIGTGGWGAGAGTLACDSTSGCWTYIPSQAETNAESFLVAVYKASCIGCQVTVVTTASATAGKAYVSNIDNDAITAASINTGAFTADAFAADAITAAAIAADASTEINAAVLAAISGIGSGTGATLNFEVADDNTGTTGDTILDSVAQLGTATGGTTFANTQADNNVYHTIASVTDVTEKIDWVYRFDAGGGRNASKVVLRAFMSAVTDTVTVQVYDHVNTDWESMASITGTTETLYDIPLYSKHTGTGTAAGKVYVRFVFNEGDAGTLNIDLAYVQAQNLGQTIGYADGAIWIGGANANTTPYVDGTADNPVTYAASKTLSSALGLTRFRVRNATTVTLDAATVNQSWSGRGYILKFGGQNISSSFFEGVEGLEGTATCATGEAIIYDSHLNAITIGEADFVRCHLMGTVTMSQNSVPYRFHDCTGISSAVIEFGGSSQACVISNASGALTITGMTTGDTLYVDGNCDLTLGATCNGGTVYLAGAIRLTNSGSGQTLYQEGHFTWAKAMADMASVPTATGSFLDAFNWMYMLSRNKITQTATTQSLKKDDGSTQVAAATVSDDGTTYTRGEWAT